MEQTGTFIDPSVQCDYCHIVPGSIGDANHFDIDDDAEVLFPNPGTNPAYFNSTTPNYTNSTLTCAVYCHGDNMPGGSNNGDNPTPAWGDTSTGCSFCHGVPPNTGSHSGGETLADCNTCHPHVNTDGTFNDVTLHINGAVDAAGGSCTACHNTGGPGREMRRRALPQAATIMVSLNSEIRIRVERSRALRTSRAIRPVQRLKRG
jgi:predicted CxxxxCH...CXXCH cytochrome family protein